VAATFGLPAGLVEKLRPVIDDLLKEAIESAKPDDRLGAQKVLDAIAPTLKAGQVEIGVAMTGSDDAGKYRVVTALRTKEGTAIEAVAKELTPFLPADKFKAEFDTAKVGGNALHKLTLPNPETKKLFGSDLAWAVTGDELFVLSFEPDATEAKRVAAGSPVGGAVVRAELSAAAAAFAFEKQIEPAKLKDLVNEAFDRKSPQGLDTALLTVTGGEKLTVSLSVKGKAVKLFAALDKARKEKGN
jgi:hypothetical protein